MKRAARVWILRNDDYEDQHILGVYDNPDTPARVQREAKATKERNLRRLEAANWEIDIPKGHLEAMDRANAVIEEWSVQSERRRNLKVEAEAR